jgi:TRAP-type C4-dicarboxylate transport system permease small subunit
MANTRRSFLVVAIKKSLLVIMATLTILVGSVGVASAAIPSNCKNNFLGIPAWYKYLNLNSQCEVVPPGDQGQLVILIMLAVFDMVLYIAGFAAVIFVIWGGFKYLTSNGDPQRAVAARTILLNALVGLAIVLVASRVVGFIAGRLG